MRIVNIILIGLFISLNACGQTPKNMNTNRQSENVQTFLSKFSTYKMNIEAAGIATIPVAALSKDNVLDIKYAYESAGENRNGQMILHFNAKRNRYEGTWETKADNGNTYNGSMYFVFSENGDADGLYQYGISDYKITIFVPK